VAHTVAGAVWRLSESEAGWTRLPFRGGYGACSESSHASASVHCALYRIDPEAEATKVRVAPALSRCHGRPTLAHPPAVSGTHPRRAHRAEA
jgi:hypothetical protein